MQKIDLEVDKDTTEVKSGLEALRELPWEQRMVFVLSNLDRLMKAAESKGYGPTITRKQEDEQLYHRGKLMAYRDTQSFLTTVFEKELRDTLMPNKEGMQ